MDLIETCSEVHHLGGKLQGSVFFFVKILGNQEKKNIHPKQRLHHRESFRCFVSESLEVLGKPDPRCKLRHTDFVEMTAPLLSSKAGKQNKIEVEYFEDGRLGGEV